MMSSMLRHDDKGLIENLLTYFLALGVQTLMPLSAFFFSLGYAIIRDPFGLIRYLYTNSTDNRRFRQFWALKNSAEHGKMGSGSRRTTRRQITYREEYHAI